TLALLALSRPAVGQQRPLVTEDPEPIGAGRVLIEGGIDYGHDQTYPVSGLTRNLVRVPRLGVRVGISSIAEFQIDSGIDHLDITKREAAALSSLVTATGTTTTDVDDVVIGTKIKLVSEAESHPAFTFRFATRLPNASNESGLGLDTFDFYPSLLVGKTVQSIRVVRNVGLGILAHPTNGNPQNHALTHR